MLAPHIYIDIAALSDATRRPFIVDGKYILQPYFPGGSYRIHPRRGESRPSFEEAVFLADCLAYDHDCIALPWRSDRLERRVPNLPLMGGADQRAYYDDQSLAINAVTFAHFGSATADQRWDDGDDGTNLGRRFKKAKKQVGLYAMAVRQLDPLSEYLCFYRIVEAEDGGNGLPWLETNLGALAPHNYGQLWITEDYQDWKNAFTILKRRASSRLHALRQRLGTDAEVAKHLYSLRCGVAHGKTPVVHDYGQTLYEAARDLPLIKLMARLAIDRRLT